MINDAGWPFEPDDIPNSVETVTMRKVRFINAKGLVRGGHRLVEPDEMCWRVDRAIELRARIPNRPDLMQAWLMPSRAKTATRAGFFGDVLARPDTEIVDWGQWEFVDPATYGFRDLLMVDKRHRWPVVSWKSPLLAAARRASPPGSLIWTTQLYNEVARMAGAESGLQKDGDLVWFSDHRGDMARIVCKDLDVAFRVKLLTDI